VLRTERLVLRPIAIGDLNFVATLNADERVMQTLGGPLTREESADWLSRILAHWREHSYGRFVATRGDTLVAIVGLSRADFDAGLMFGIEIAWRAPYEQWGNGYVTEAARTIIADAFDGAMLPEIVSATSVGNSRSHRVMERLGMIRSPIDDFDYARFPPNHPLRRHHAYRLPREMWQAAQRRISADNPVV
jgi:RimJ/RimL family protein N-acetyltransferase